MMVSDIQGIYNVQNSDALNEISCFVRSMIACFMSIDAKRNTFEYELLYEEDMQYKVYDV